MEKILLTGASGFIGSALKLSLLEQGYEVIGLGREIISLSTDELLIRLNGVSVVVNLAGSPILGRWTKELKKQISDSRMITTQKLVEAILLMPQPPEVLISGSAIGIYPGEGIHSEDGKVFSDDFLGKLCLNWETEAMKGGSSCRVVLLRTGVVLGKNGGALASMLPLFRLGLGGVIASGKQGFSWIHLADMIRAIEFIILDKQLSGPVNMVSPIPLDNRGFTTVLARVIHRPALIKTPAFMLKLLFGEGAVVVTEGQRVLPKRLLDAGFEFRFRELEKALQDITGKT